MTNAYCEDCDGECSIYESDVPPGDDEEDA